MITRADYTLSVQMAVKCEPCESFRLAWIPDAYKHIQ